MSAPIHCLCLSVPPLEEWKSTRCIWIWTSPLLPPSKQFHSSQPACSHSTHNNAEKKILLCINADSPTGCLLWPHQLPPDLGETRVFSPKWKQQQQQLSAPWYTMEETSVKISFQNIREFTTLAWWAENSVCRRLHVRQLLPNVLFHPVMWWKTVQ